MKKPLADFDRIKAADELKQQTLAHILCKQPQRRRTQSVLIGIGGCIACVLLLFFIKPAPIVPVKDTAYAYVTLDINPSVELQLNEQNEVIKTNAYNKDGEALLAQLTLINRSLDESINALLTNEMFMQYMEDGYLQVSVYSEDTKHSADLEAQLDQTLSHHYSAEQYGCSCASKNDHKRASSHHMSFGRYQLIEDIIALKSTYTIEALENKTMRELKVLYESLAGQLDNREQKHHGKHHEE